MTSVHHFFFILPSGSLKILQSEGKLLQEDLLSSSQHWLHAPTSLQPLVLEHEEEEEEEEQRRTAHRPGQKGGGGGGAEGNPDTLEGRLHFCIHSLSEILSSLSLQLLTDVTTETFRQKAKTLLIQKYQNNKAEEGEI